MYQRMHWCWISYLFLKTKFWELCYKNENEFIFSDIIHLNIPTLLLLLKHTYYYYWFIHLSVLDFLKNSVIVFCLFMVRCNYTCSISTFFRHGSMNISKTCSHLPMSSHQSWANATVCLLKPMKRIIRVDNFYHSVISSSHLYVLAYTS